MPLSAYFKGKGEKVMDDMTDRYGKKGGKSAFYATAKKKKMAPKKKGKKLSAKEQMAALRGK